MGGRVRRIAAGRRGGLATGARGRLVVDETPRSASHPDVYGAGDAAAVAKEAVVRGAFWAARHPGGYPSGVLRAA